MGESEGVGESEGGQNDGNDAVWLCEQTVSQWVAGSEERERRRGEQRRLVAELLPFDDAAHFSFVDLGAGTGTAARAVLDRYPNAFAILAEYSPQMIEEGRRALACYQERYEYVNLDLKHGPWPEEIPAELPAVISSLCVHHLPDERKWELFAEIYARLAPGGWYLNYDAVSTADPIVAA
ncbi:MAG TPA: class I SAM-dependent methyltransferase, partial [Acidimicrobiales bacterium]|nr:class I SAM-dependent methyltransferase [Acidimicrobiales bacterium]